MKKAKHTPTPEQQEFFFRCVAEHQSRLNLKDWRIENSGSFANKGAFADVGVSLEDRLAVISLGKDFGPVPVTDKLLNETALHEVLHVFLAPLVEAARSRDEGAMLSAEHSVVVVLEKLLA